MRQSVRSKHNTEDDKSQIMQKSLELFYEEVNNLLKSISDLFKLKEDKSIAEKLTKGDKEHESFGPTRSALDIISQNADTSHKKDILKPTVLNKKLEKIILEK